MKSTSGESHPELSLKEHSIQHVTCMWSMCRNLGSQRDDATVDVLCAASLSITASEHSLFALWHGLTPVTFCLTCDLLSIFDRGHKCLLHMFSHDDNEALLG